MNTATKITVARIFLIIPAAVCFILAFETSYMAQFLIACAVIFVLLCSTDFIDGYIARHTNTVSNLGKFLDPLADKVVITIMLFLIIWKASEVFDTQIYPYASLVLSLLAGITISRELIIGIFRLLAVQKNVVLAADIYGKIKTVFLDVSVVFLILTPFHTFFYWAGQILFYIGAILAIGSGLNYILKNLHLFQEIEINLKDADTAIEGADVE